MSESRFIYDMGKEFKQNHPAKDGWIIHRIDPTTHCIFTPLLPAFLRTRAPDSIARERIFTAIAWSETKKGKRTCISENPCRKEGAGFTEETWYGDIDIVWQGSPIHYSSYVMSDRIGWEIPLVFIATKNKSALENLWRNLRKFYREIMEEGSSIYIISEGPVPRPCLTWDDLILPGNMQEDIRQSVESFMIAGPKYEELNLPYRRGLLFTGPPGGGKTLAVKVIASHVNTRVFILPIKSETDDVYIMQAFRLAAEESPSVLILEDIDKLNNSKKVSISHLLNLMDGISSLEGVLFIATTNEPEKLDPALIQRPSRFDRVWYFSLPGFEQRYELMKKKGLGKFSNNALSLAARMSDGFTMAYVQEAVVGAMLQALHGNRKPEDGDLLSSIEKLRKQYVQNQKSDGCLSTIQAVGFKDIGGNSERDGE